MHWTHLNPLKMFPKSVKKCVFEIQIREEFKSCYFLSFGVWARKIEQAVIFSIKYVRVAKQESLGSVRLELQHFPIWNCTIAHRSFMKFVLPGDFEPWHRKIWICVISHPYLSRQRPRLRRSSGFWLECGDSPVGCSCRTTWNNSSGSWVTIQDHLQLIWNSVAHKNSVGVHTTQEVRSSSAPPNWL